MAPLNTDFDFTREEVSTGVSMMKTNENDCAKIENKRLRLHRMYFNFFRLLLLL